MARQRDWRTTKIPARLQDFTEDMLAPIRQAARASHLPQTVWPSRYFGRDFVGVDCLLVSMACPGPGDRPHHAAPGTQPLLTILPPYYFCTTNEHVDQVAAHLAEHGPRYPTPVTTPERGRSLHSADQA